MKTQLWKHQTFLLLFLFQVQVSDLDDSSRPATDICATHTILSGPKGDEGKKGDSGEVGRQGKVGPTGSKGSKGVVGETGDHGPMGKIGPIGKKGDKGLKGLSGTSGEKGKADTSLKIKKRETIYCWNWQDEGVYKRSTVHDSDFAKAMCSAEPDDHMTANSKLLLVQFEGAVCDCGRYRKVIGQLDITVARLKSSMNFVKNVLAGIRETEEKYYYIVQEEKSYREALTHCRIRDGILAMPKDEAANAVISEYISKSGLFRVFIGVNDMDREGHFMYADRTPLQNYSNWKEGEPDDTSGQEDCVEMLSTGKWNDTECHFTMFFICEFPKKRQ